MMEPLQMRITSLVCFVFGLVIYFNMTHKNITPKETHVEESYITPRQPKPKEVYAEESYEPLQSMDHYPNTFPVRHCGSNQTYVDFGSGDILTDEQKANVEKCFSSYMDVIQDSYDAELIDRNIRYTSHSYLTQQSVVIEAGGHRGIDTGEINSRFRPGYYYVLEPVPSFYNLLVQKFNESKNVVVFNFGIDSSDGTFHIQESSNDAVSIFAPRNETGEKIYIVDTTKFFEKISVRSRDVDLITMDCEGCEYAVLDRLLTTDYIRHFRNIQFQPHRIDRICFPLRRYCWYQELLRKTHKLSFQFKFLWENWKQL
ncbi:uncharacterized protein [Argopecten irradians]|uniref:uncharacterized protein n=1 Tax=Argopecten irradians TaxID=31199 RepID=UPI0037133C59